MHVRRTSIRARRTETDSPVKGRDGELLALSLCLSHLLFLLALSLSPPLCPSSLVSMMKIPSYCTGTHPHTAELWISNQSIYFQETCQSYNHFLNLVSFSTISAKSASQMYDAKTANRKTIMLSL